MDLKEAFILGENAGRHWYYASKGRALLQLLKGLSVETVLDIGAGSGVFSRQLLDAGVCRRAVCVDPAYRAEGTERHNDREIRFAHSPDQGPADIILMMDVLEHVDDDVALLRRSTARLRPHDQVVITVPAFQFLWSGHDEFLEHRRRYTRRQVEAVVRAAGLEPVKSGYFFGLLFPLAAVQRLFDRWRRRSGGGPAKSALSVQGNTVNTILIAVHDLERKVVFPFNRLAGLTVFCLARRPG
jgi:SAM-dependent methyltransferase